MKDEESAATAITFENGDFEAFAPFGEGRIIAEMGVTCDTCCPGSCTGCTKCNKCDFAF